MEHRTLGRSGISVSSVALGCMSLCGNQTYPDISVDQAIATVDAALEAGINFFDNAPMYGDGEAERRLGLALRGKRERAVIATKISTETLSSAEVAREAEASLRRLGTDYIDHYQIHWARHAVPIDETIGAMDRLVQAGKVRALGVCNFGPIDLGDALRAGQVASNQLAYSLLARGVEYEVQPMCVENQIGLLCYSPLAQGLLTGRYRSADDVPPERARTRHFAGNRPQARHGLEGCEAETFQAIQAIRGVCEEVDQPMSDIALAWLLHQPAVTAVLAGASKPDQVARNVRAADLKLPADTLHRLDRATSALKASLGPNCDPWQAVSRIR
jgi:aryl-alcohol dehydrogenase-like predicted oxidoreductase